jgi:hypothetical protein
MKCICHIVGLVVSSIFIANGVLADSSSSQHVGWYLGAGAGQGEMEVVGHDRSKKVAQQLTALGINATETSGGENDGTDTYKFFVGYQFDDYWLVEGSWQDLGDTDGTFQATLPDTSVINGKIESEYQAAALTLIGQYPVFERTTLMIKLGAHHWEQKFKLKGNDGSSVTDKDNGTDYIYGVGLGVDLNDSFSMRLEWERFNGIEDEEGADVKSVNLIYKW